MRKVRAAARSKSLLHRRYGVFGRHRFADAYRMPELVALKRKRFEYPREPQLGLAR